MEVIHNIPDISFEQGRGILALIFIRKLNAYKEEIIAEGLNLMDRGKGLDLLENTEKKSTFVQHERKRLTKERKDLKDLIAHITDLIDNLFAYGNAESELNTMDVRYKKEFKDAFNFFGDLFSDLHACEKLFIEKKLQLDKAIFEQTNADFLEKEIVDIRNERHEKYRQLKQVNEMLKKFFLAGQPTYPRQSSTPSSSVSMTFEPPTYPLFFFSPPPANSPQHVQAVPQYFQTR